MLLSNFYLHRNITEYPADLKTVRIQTKRNQHTYIFKRFLKAVYPSQHLENWQLPNFQSAWLLEAVKLTTNETQLDEYLKFALVLTPHGMFVGNVTRNENPSDTFKKSYHAFLGLSFTMPEVAKKQELLPYLQQAYGVDNVEEPKVDDDLRLFHKKTYKKETYLFYQQKYREWMKSELKNKVVYLKPDFRIKINHKKALFELEVKLHEQGDFYWKLLRLKGLNKQTYFIFNDVETLKVDNFDYHVNLIAAFEREVNKKFQGLYVCRLSEFLVFQHQAFINFRHIAI